MGPRNTRKTRKRRRRRKAAGANEWRELKRISCSLPYSLQFAPFVGLVPLFVSFVSFVDARSANLLPPRERRRQTARMSENGRNLRENIVLVGFMGSGK